MTPTDQGAAAMAMTGNPPPGRPVPATGSAQVDAEHRVQVSLVADSLAALSGQAEDASELVEQLFTYTKAHFLYEQLLMRRASSSEYEGHVREHDRLLAQLSTVRERTRSGSYAEAAEHLEVHEQDLLEHIGSWDQSIE